MLVTFHVHWYLKHTKTLNTSHSIRLDRTRLNMETNNNEDPFRVRLNFTAVDYIRMSILAVTLLPIRLTGDRDLT